MKKRLLSLLLLVAMVLTLLPGGAMAATSVSSDADPYRIVMLDCGRKYFSVANIEKLIDTMAKYGYNQLQLSFGNGGCRFLLDDMSLSFGSVTMDSDTVKSNITEGNNAFNGDTRYLSQSEMDVIIAHAQSKGIEIVPMLNMPGHASAIVYDTSYSDNGNLDVANETAREYGYALLGKYVEYFKNKGCKFFHFGADESGYTGTNMSTFLQGCVDVITAAGMTPRMFNDPADSSGSTTIPVGVQITYWYINSHKSASALANAGYDLINTHGRWYYVIKGAQNSEIGTKYWQGTVNTSAVSVELPVMKAEKMDNYWVGINEFFDANPGSGSTISSSLGTMFCIWCDASQDTYLTDSDVISDNENYGALYQLQKMAEHYWPDDIDTETEGDGETTDSVTMTDSTGTTVGATQAANLTTGGTATFTVNNLADGQTISLVSSNESVATASYANGAITVTAHAAGTATITGTVASTSGVATLALGDELTINVTVADEQPTEPTTQTVNLEVGEEVTFDTTGAADDYITDDNRYIATANVTVVPGTTETTVSTTKATELEDGATYIIRVFDTNYALSSNAGRGDWGTQTLAFESNTLAANVEHMWTLEAVNGGGYKIKSNAGYLNLGTGNNAAYLNTTGEVFTITSTNTGWTIGNQSGKYINALGGLYSYYSAGGWTGDGTRFDLYKVTTATESSTTLTITGTGEGTTTVTIGGVEYTINVTATETTENKALSYDGTLTLPDGAEDIKITSGEGVVTLNDGTITAGNADGTATVTFVTKNAGGYVTAKYTYNITVAEVDLSDVDPLSVELWLIDRHVPASGDSGSHETLQSASDDCNNYSISAADAYGESGVLLSSLIPFNAEDEQGNAVIFWKGTQLTGDNIQRHNDDAVKSGDKTSSGNDFEKIRYYDNRWWYYSNNAWTEVTADDQIVAYYMQVYATSPEITTAFKDYGGLAGNGAGEDESPFTWATAPTGLYGVGTAVVYSDSSMSPENDEAIWNTTLQLQYAYGAGSTPGRIVAYNTDNYRITKITITRGYHADSAGNLITTLQTGWNRNDQVIWNKVENEDGSTWYDETPIWEAIDGQNQDVIVLDHTIWGNTWVTASGNNEAFLILFYVEPVEKEDSLEIIYWDDSGNCKINPNDVLVSVVDGKTFYDITQSSSLPTKGEGGTFTLDDDATITNSAGVARNINKNISILDGVAARYKTGIYKYVSAELSADGKTLTLHYAIDPNELSPLYVIDFGLPVQFALSEVIDNSGDVKSVSFEAGTYGALTYDENTKIFTYTPREVLKNTDAVKLTFTLNNGETISKRIGFAPASNVLYEEGFMSIIDNVKRAQWTNNASKVNDTEDAKQTADNTLRYGYDSVYNNETGISGGTYSATVSETDYLTEQLTFQISNAEALDIIGDASTTSANLYVTLQGGGSTKIVVVDTSIKTTVGGATTVHQVPLAHIAELDPTVTYTVRVYGGYLSSASAQTFGGFGGGSPIYQIYSNLYEIADEIGLSDEDIENAEFVGFDNYSVATFALEGEEEVGGANNTSTDQSMVIDGFRVYHPTSNSAYADGEKDAIYSNVTDATSAGEFAAYIDDASGDGSYKITDYENEGGPQDEIYLYSGQGVVFALKDASGLTKAQISARAVLTTIDGNGNEIVVGTKLNNQQITSNTEMYYEVDVTNGVITVVNTGEGMLAIANIKAMAKLDTINIYSAPVAETVSFSLRRIMNTEDTEVEDGTDNNESTGSEDAETPETPVEPETPSVPSTPVKPNTPSIIWPTYTPSQKDVFRPDVFEMDVESYTLFGKRFVSIVVDASTDVEKLTINGTPVWANNYLLVRTGLDDQYHFTMLLLLDVGEMAHFEVVAYDKNGLASKTYTITD